MPYVPRRGPSKKLDSGIKSPVGHVNAEMNPGDSQVMPAVDLAARRYFRLIHELAEEHEAPKHGWRVRVAMRLGIDQSYLTRLMSGERATVGAEAIDRAVHCLGLQRRYFEGPHDPTSYRDYLGTEPEVREPTSRGWLEFLASPIGLEITPSERRTLASIVFEPGDEPHAGFYEGTLYMLRNRVTPAEAARGIAKAAELEAKLLQNRNR